MRNARMTVSVMVIVEVLFCFYLPKAGAIVIFDDGQTHNVDWTINDTVEVRDDSFFGRITTLNLLSGGWISTVYAEDRSVINVCGGRTGGLLAGDRSVVNVSSGQVGENLVAANSSVLTISGGSITHNLYANGSALVTISGGSIRRDLFAFNSALVTVSGGLLEGGIWAGNTSSHASVITFDGTDFAINGISVGYGEFDTGGRDWIHGTLTGTLANGDPLNNGFYIYGDSSIVLVPEPATLLLLGLGAVVLRRRHKEVKSA